MNTGGRLALYAAGLAVAFGAAFGLAGAIVPDSYVAAWAEKSTMNTHGDEHGDPDQPAAEALDGLALEADGYALSPVTAPATVHTEGTLSFQILGADGIPTTEFTTSHEKELHLIVVRSDGALFRHVHPTLDASGTWSIPWAWAEAGTYRIYADFTPMNASAVTLTRTVQVAGAYTPVNSAVQATDEVAGYTVSIDGHLLVGTASDLVISISRDGVPVTTLQPYLGAFGHLVVLREGDLAFLHAHAEIAELGQSAGPDIVFAAKAPTPGRYLLYLDFQIDEVVHTAEFVLDTGH